MRNVVFTGGVNSQTLTALIRDRDNKIQSANCKVTVADMITNATIPLRSVIANK